MRRRRSTAPSPSNFSPSTAARSCPWTPCRQGGESDFLEEESTLRCCDRYLPITFQCHDRTDILGPHSPTALIQCRGNRHENPTAKRNFPFPPHSMAVAMDRKIPTLDVNPHTPLLMAAATTRRALKPTKHNAPKPRNLLDRGDISEVSAMSHVRHIFIQRHEPPTKSSISKNNSWCKDPACRGRDRLAPRL